MITEQEKKQMEQTQVYKLWDGRIESLLSVFLLEYYLSVGQSEGVARTPERRCS